jgi:hypothetical protein
VDLERSGFGLADDEQGRIDRCEARECDCPGLKENEAPTGAWRWPRRAGFKLGSDLPPKKLVVVLPPSAESEINMEFCLPPSR